MLAPDHIFASGEAQLHALRPRVDRALATTLDAGCAAAPSRLAEAMRYAVFPGGARTRPLVCLCVATALGDPVPAAADAVAVALELLHSASLAHDDLPCFDDADRRRGQPSTHRRYGEPIAVLTGDALVVLAFETLAGLATDVPDLFADLHRTVSAGVRASGGIIGGQALECEPGVPSNVYRRMKTAPLFEAASAAGAIVARADPEKWRDLGRLLGEACQIVDDIRDVVGRPCDIGKPVGRDRALGRPNAVHEWGVGGASARLDRTLGEALEVVDNCNLPKGAAAVVHALVHRFGAV